MAFELLWDLAELAFLADTTEHVIERAASASSFLGEPLYRMAHMMLRGRSIVPAAWRETVAAVISPAVGLNRMVFGSRFGDAFDDHDPASYGRLHIGLTHVAKQSFDTSAEIKSDMVQADFLLDYGSHRSASYPTAGDRRQTLGTVGIYYTLLSSDGRRAGLAACHCELNKALNMVVAVALTHAAQATPSSGTYVAYALAEAAMVGGKFELNGARTDSAVCATAHGENTGFGAR